MVVKLHNTKTKKIEVFKPLKDNFVGIYSCGPTVYNYAHIGNLRSYIFSDILKRTMLVNGFDVKHVINITDVGHLSSDGDEGEDKMTKALHREGLPLTLDAMTEIGDKYQNAFVDDLKKLNILLPEELPKASNHIKEDIEIIKSLEEKGFTYKTSDGVYFDTTKDKNYGELGGLSENTEARIEGKQEKKNQRDFALWKFNPNLGWESPWGKGFPGWHIECSGMSMKYLGEEFDIHTGGIDHIPVHHNNEIAQSKNATGKSYANVWMHNAFLNIGLEKISKSLGNVIYLSDIEKAGHSPLSFRYLLLQSHYRNPVNFSWEALEAAETALNKLIEFSKENEEGEVNEKYKEEFMSFVNDDLDTPKALALVWKMLKDDHLTNEDKKATLLSFDKVLGFGLDKVEKDIIPDEIIKLAEGRESAREHKDYNTADQLRRQIEQAGYEVLDSEGGYIIKKKI